MKKPHVYTWGFFMNERYLALIPEGVIFGRA